LSLDGFVKLKERKAAEEPRRTMSWRWIGRSRTGTTRKGMEETEEEQLEGENW
jgi:hypothetical protein